MPSVALLIAGAYFGVFALALGWNLVTSVLAGMAARLRYRPHPVDNPASPPAIVVTLVHGTWARRATWMAPGSALRGRLRRAADAPILFRRFIWSGRNSISARRRAVDGLVEHLHSLIGQWPNAQHYIVAHSHGGNIAFQALSDPMLNERIAGLACLSTPFLTAARRDLGPVGGIALWWLPVLVVFYGSMFIMQRAKPGTIDTLGPVLLGMAVASGFLTSRLLRRFGTSVLRSLRYPEVDPSKILVLRAAGDEASAALAATHFISWITGRLWLIASDLLGRTADTVECWRAVLLRHWWATATIASCLGLVCLVAFVNSSQSAAWLNGIFVVSALGLLLMIAVLFRGGLAAALFGRVIFAAIAAPFLMLIALLGTGLGPELLFAGLLFQVTAEATPPGQWMVWQVAASADDSDQTVPAGLMHSASYQNPRALEILEAWFAAAVRGHTYPRAFHNLHGKTPMPTRNPG